MALLGLGVDTSPVTAAQVPTALIPNDGTVGFLDPHTEQTAIDEFDRVTLMMDWAVPPGTRSGDTIRIVLPPALDELSFQAFSVEATIGLVLGTASLDRSDPANPALVFTFNSNVELGTAGVFGDTSFALSVDRGQLTFVDGEAEIDVYGDPVTVTQNPFVAANVPKKTGNWRPDQVTATAVDSNGALIQTSRHMEYAVYLPIDTAQSSADNWTTVSFTEPPLNGFRAHCTNFGPNQLNGFRVEVLQPGVGFVQVPVPSPTLLQLTSVTCNGDGSMTVTAVKPAADTGRYYRIFYNATLLTDGLGRPIYTDANGQTVVGFPTEYRNNALVTAGQNTYNVGTEVGALSGQAVGQLVNLPDVDIEKFSAETWQGVQFGVDGVPLLTGGADPQPQNPPNEDFDVAPGKALLATASQVVRFRITNIGTEPLTGIVVSDSTTTGAAIGSISCDFTGWGGPATGTNGEAALLPPQQSVECTGILPALGDAATHADTASVSAVGVTSQIPVSDLDAWHATTPAAPPPEETTTTTVAETTTTVAETTTTTTTVVAPGPPSPTTVPPVAPGQLPATGGDSQQTMLFALLVAGLGSVLFLIARRRRSA